MGRGNRGGGVNDTNFCENPTWTFVGFLHTFVFFLLRYYRPYFEHKDIQCHFIAKPTNFNYKGHKKSPILEGLCICYKRKKFLFESELNVCLRSKAGTYSHSFYLVNLIERKSG